MRDTLSDCIDSNEWLDKSLVIIPTYNERENLPALLDRLRALPGNVNVLVVDDSSPDGTGTIADDFSARDEGIHVLHRSGKLGLGSAYQDGFRFGLGKNYHYMCTMDADFSHQPEALPDLLNLAASGYDLVIGSRYVPGGSVVGSTAPRKLVSYTANMLAHVFLGIQARDCTAGFRCYRRRVLETIDLEAIFSNGYSFLTEMAFLSQRAGFRIGEAPITFVNRTQGKSKINSREIYKAFYTVARLTFTRVFTPWRADRSTLSNEKTSETSHAATK